MELSILYFSLLYEIPSFLSMLTYFPSSFDFFYFSLFKYYYRLNRNRHEEQCNSNDIVFKLSQINIFIRHMAIVSINKWLKKILEKENTVMRI